MHNFNFPKVSFVKTALHDKNNFAIIFPYSYEKDELKINKEELTSLMHNVSLSETLEIINLSKKEGDIFGTFIGRNYLIFVNTSNEKFETNIVNSISKVPSTIDNIEVHTDNYSFYDKLLVSKTIFSLKNDWTLKTKTSELKQKDIYFVSKNADNLNLNLGKALAECQSFVQQLVNMPANYLTPTKFGELIQEQITENQLDKIKIEILDEKELKKLKMGSFLGVAKGSKEEAKMIVLQYKGLKTNKAPIVLVGKGLTFDSGGISLKPSAGMADMKGDMAGAATALSAVLYAAKAELPINLVAIAACCENMPSGKSVKPGDVISAMDGTTIEVIDTDAEGRLVLADALLYSKQFKGKYTVDLATLTGACIVALGHIHTGVFSKDNELAQKIVNSGNKIKDLAWQLPLDDAHEEMLESKVADISNLCIGKGAGAQNGAIFLKRFAPENGWCHLDIAGTSAGKGTGATSRPMAMLSEFLDNEANEINDKKKVSK